LLALALNCESIISGTEFDIVFFFWLHYNIGIKYGTNQKLKKTQPPVGTAVMAASQVKAVKYNTIRYTIKLYYFPKSLLSIFRNI